MPTFLWLVWLVAELPFISPLRWARPSARGGLVTPHIPRCLLLNVLPTAGTRCRYATRAALCARTLRDVYLPHRKAFCSVAHSAHRFVSAYGIQLPRRLSPRDLLRLPCYGALLLNGIHPAIPPTPSPPNTRTGLLTPPPPAARRSPACHACHLPTHLPVLPYHHQPSRAVACWVWAGARGRHGWRGQDWTWTGGSCLDRTRLRRRVTSSQRIAPRCTWRHRPSGFRSASRLYFAQLLYISGVPNNNAFLHLGICLLGPRTVGGARYTLLYYSSRGNISSHARISRYCACPRTPPTITADRFPPTYNAVTWTRVTAVRKHHSYARTCAA